MIEPECIDEVISQDYKMTRMLILQLLLHT
jgi:hypothetical protein